MTIEQYLECSADQLEQMTDAQLEEHFKQYIPITRPELGAIPQKMTESIKKKPSEGKAPSITNEKLERAKKIAEEMGFSDMFKF